jgi:hypothetical protein
MMKHYTNYGEPVVDTAKFCQKCGTKVLPPISLIPLVERDDEEDDLIYKGSFKKKKKKKRVPVAKDEKFPSIMDTGSGTGSGTGTGSSTSTSTGPTFLGRAISGSSTVALEVKNGRAKATIEDWVTTKEMKSRYSVDPKNVEKWIAEIWTMEKGLTPCRFPTPRHLIKLHPLQSVSN